MTPDAGQAGWASLFWVAFERSGNSMLLLQPDRVIVAVNQACEELLGYLAGELIGRRSDSLLTPGGWRQVDADWAALQRTGDLLVERALVRADERRVEVHLAARREVVTGRQLVLVVVLESRVRPLTARGDGEATSTALTPRELEVVTHVAMGQRAHEIADHLHIEPTTVRTHTRNAMAKVGARSQAQLVAIVLAHGMLDPDGVNR